MGITLAGRRQDHFLLGVRGVQFSRQGLGRHAKGGIGGLEVQPTHRAAETLIHECAREPGQRRIRQAQTARPVIDDARRQQMRGRIRGHAAHLGMRLRGFAGLHQRDQIAAAGHLTLEQRAGVGVAAAAVQSAQRNDTVQRTGRRYTVLDDGAQGQGLIGHAAADAIAERAQASA